MFRKGTLPAQCGESRETRKLGGTRDGRNVSVLTTRGWRCLNVSAFLGRVATSFDASGSRTDRSVWHARWPTFAPCANVGPFRTPSRNEVLKILTESHLAIIFPKRYSWYLLKFSKYRAIFLREHRSPLRSTACPIRKFFPCRSSGNRSCKSFSCRTFKNRLP